MHGWMDELIYPSASVIFTTCWMFALVITLSSRSQCFAWCVLNTALVGVNLDLLESQYPDKARTTRDMLCVQQEICCDRHRRQRAREALILQCSYESCTWRKAKKNDWIGSLRPRTILRLYWPNLLEIYYTTLHPTGQSNGNITPTKAQAFGGQTY